MSPRCVDDYYTGNISHPNEELGRPVWPFVLVWGKASARTASTPAGTCEAEMLINYAVHPFQKQERRLACARGEGRKLVSGFADLAKLLTAMFKKAPNASHCTKYSALGSSGTAARHGTVYLLLARL